MCKKNRSGTPMPKIKTACISVVVSFLALAAVYLVFSFSNIPFIRTLRHMAIETSLSTMRHQWVAYAIFPDNIVDEVDEAVKQARKNQVGVSSVWENAVTPRKISANSRRHFFELFWELDHASVDAYLSDRLYLLRDGWENLHINEAGLEDNGTSILTKQGDSVLAIDAKNGVLLIRVEDFGYQGVLAIAKDPYRLSVRPSAVLGSDGQLAGEIAAANNGILAMTANGFMDIDQYGNRGLGNGGIPAGIIRSNGVTYGSPLGAGFKRAELRKNGLLYIVDSETPVHKDCTDAAEFMPALIVDGDIVVDDTMGWNSINPRACIGQNDKGEIMMLCVEGRQLSSLGIGVTGCAKILKRFGCMQAMNMDGGTSAVLWYDGECVTRCSNEEYPQGRPLPAVFVYENA